MNDFQASIITILGMRGCGKSTLTREIASQQKFSRKIVFDYVEEWQGSHVAKNFDEFAQIWRQVFNQNSYTIVIRFDFGTHEDLIQETTSQIVTLVYRTGRESQLHTCMVFEEAQFYFPSNFLHPVFKSLITTGRHAKISVICNTQRPASLNKLVISQSPEIYIGRLFEMNDMKYLSETAGEIAFHARDLKPFEFIYFNQGYPENTAIVTI